LRLFWLFFGQLWVVFDALERFSELYLIAGFTVPSKQDCAFVQTLDASLRASINRFNCLGQRSEVTTDLGGGEQAQAPRSTGLNKVATWPRTVSDICL
jgi:hypothetical protein